MLTRNALLYLSNKEGLKDFATRFKPFKKITTRFIAGENIDEAVAAIRDLNARGRKLLTEIVIHGAWGQPAKLS